MSAGIAYKITCTIDDKETTILLDTINETSVNTSSNLTQHPIVNGDMVADHMYKDPITISLSGSFSLNGGTLMNISSTGSSLSNNVLPCPVLDALHKPLYLSVPFHTRLIGSSLFIVKKFLVIRFSSKI